MNSNKRTLWIIGGVVGVVLLCICVVGIGLTVAGGSIFREASTIATEVSIPTTVVEEGGPVVATGEDSPDAAANTFLELLSSNQYTEAVAMTTVDLREDAATQGALQEIVEDKALQPSSWEWTNQSSNEDGSEVYFEGTMTYANGTTGPAQVQVRQEDGVWRVFYLDLKTDAAAESSGAWTEWSESQQETEVALAQASGDAFMTLWQAGDYASAYEMTTQEMKDSVGTADDLAAILNGIGAKPESWTWEQWEFVDIGAEYPVIDLQGTATYPAGQRGPIQVQVEQQDGTWKVRFFNIEAE